jgi:hypothetical protein
MEFGLLKTMTLINLMKVIGNMPITLLIKLKV